MYAVIKKEVKDIEVSYHLVGGCRRLKRALKFIKDTYTKNVQYFESDPCYVGDEKVTISPDGMKVYIDDGTYKSTFYIREVKKLPRGNYNLH